MLTRHPDAEAIALLRRAVASGDADLAVEAALALEDLGAQLDVSAAAATRSWTTIPGSNARSRTRTCWPTPFIRVCPMRP